MIAYSSTHCCVLLHARKQYRGAIINLVDLFDKYVRVTFGRFVSMLWGARLEGHVMAGWHLLSVK